MINIRYADMTHETRMLDIHTANIYIIIEITKYYRLTMTRVNTGMLSAPPCFPIMNL